MGDLVTYDVETTSVYAPYAELKMIGYQVNEELPQLVDMNSVSSCRRFRQLVANPSNTKVSYNGINYDEIVLRLHGYPIEPTNSHDVFLMIKTVCPMLPAYGLKFVNWYFFADVHEAERKLHAWLKHNGLTNLYQAPAELLGTYCLYDVKQTYRLWKMFLPLIQKERHWNAYSQVELPMREVLHEMILEGGDCLNIGQIRREIKKLEERVKQIDQDTILLTQGRVTNAASSKQVARELVNIEKFELETSLKGNLLLRKEDLLTMLDLDDPSNDNSRLGRLTFEIRDAHTQLGFLRSYRRAALFELRHGAARQLYRRRGYVQIPKSYSLSTARTRRILSNSRFKINFTNQNDVGKTIQLVPPRWVGVWIDLSQIENVIHIWKSKDYARRRSYEADPEWNEYVWLCNRILGGNRTRKELDALKSNANPAWSIYKQYKTAKLALNFGMGLAKFCRSNGIPEREGKRIFDDIHKACPAIRGLQYQIRNEIAKQGYVQDPFGHIYSGSGDMAYKVVAYFIQGTGTGSVPKVMARGIYDVLQELERQTREATTPRLAVMTGIIHDEIGFRIRTCVGSKKLGEVLKDCMDICEGKFSHLFDGIPLRAKLYLSRTNTKAAQLVDHHAPDFEGTVRRLVYTSVPPLTLSK